MSAFHNHNHNHGKDNKGKFELNEVVISGQLLSTLIDETISIDNEAISINGLLLGNRNLTNILKSVDNVEDVYESKHEIHITNFINFKTSYGLWDGNNSIKDFSNYNIDSDIVGLLVLQNYDNQSSQLLPSFRDMAAASQLYRKECLRSSSESIPFLILVISVPSNQDNWIFSIKYTCYVINSENDNLSVIKIKIPSLAADSSSDYSKCLNKKIPLSTTIPNITSLSIQKATSLELLADDMLDKIYEQIKETVELENEIRNLREILKK